MNIFNYILDVFSDIGTDFEAAEHDADVTWEESGSFRQRRRGGAGLWAIIWPQLVGAVLGLSVARVFKPGAVGYLVCAVLFGVIVGTYKSVSFDKIALKHALIRNVIIMVTFATLIGLCILL